MNVTGSPKPNSSLSTRPPNAPEVSTSTVSPGAADSSTAAASASVSSKARALMPRAWIIRASAAVSRRSASGIFSGAYSGPIHTAVAASKPDT
jgi:hypothetical protein